MRSVEPAVRRFRRKSFSVRLSQFLLGNLFILSTLIRHILTSFLFLKVEHI